MNASKMWPLSVARRAIVAGGALGMAFTQLTTSPATVRYARDLGATELDIGILSALPLALIGVQLLAAPVGSRFAGRKPVWFWVSIVQRLVLVPAAMGPWLWPEAGDGFWIGTLLALSAVNHALTHFGTPLWMSWMGDYLPRAGLSRFWGQRNFAQQWAAAAALLFNTICFFHASVDVRRAFAGLIALAAALGVADILLFIRIPEPPAPAVRAPRMGDMLREPLRHADFRRFIQFTCFFQVAAMVGAPFISMYLLECVGMDLFHVLLLWSVAWIGGAAMSNRLGAWAERFGQRPVLIWSVAFKSANMIALVCLPRDPETAFWILVPVFMFDAALNAGYNIATNAYLLKNSPPQSRTMFIAAGTAFAGMAGGATSILAGGLLGTTASWSAEWRGGSWVNFHVMFAASVLLRLAAIGLAVRVRERGSAGAIEAIGQLARDGAFRWTGRQKKLPEPIAAPVFDADPIAAPLPAALSPAAHSAPAGSGGERRAA